MIKAVKKTTLTLFISSAIACSGLAQSAYPWTVGQREKGGKKPPERPVEKKRNGDQGGERGGGKRDDGGKKDKKPGQFF